MGKRVNSIIIVVITALFLVAHCQEGKAATSMHAAFITAVAGNRKAAVQKLLLNPRLNINSFNSDGYTALHIAAAQQAIDTLKLLLADHRLNLARTAKDADGIERLPIESAIMTGNEELGLEIFRAMKKNQVLPLLPLNRALALSAQLGQHNLLTKIAALRGISLEAAFDAACAKNDLAAAQTLSDSLVKTGARKINQWHIVKKLISSFEPSAKKNAILKQLLAVPNIDPNSTDTFSPLIEAALIGDIEAAKALIQHGANIHAKGPTGATAYVIASNSPMGTPEASSAISQLLAPQIEPTFNAVRNRDLIALKRLSSAAFFNINSLNARGQTLLTAAIQAGDINVFNFIVAYPMIDLRSPELNLAKQSATTPLEVATKAALFCQEGEFENRSEIRKHLIDLLLANPATNSGCGKSLLATN